jgi:hypothetical protein
LIGTVDSVDWNHGISTIETLEGRGFRCFCENEQEKGGEAIMKWIATNVLRAAFVLIVMCGMFPLANAQEVSRDCGGGDCGGGSTVTGEQTRSSNWHLAIEGVDAVNRPAVGCIVVEYDAWADVGELTWSISGTNVSINPATGEVEVCDNSCGSYTVTVTDQRHSSVSKDVRIENAGHFVEIAREAKSGWCGSYGGCHCIKGKYYYDISWTDFCKRNPECMITTGNPCGCDCNAGGGCNCGSADGPFWIKITREWQCW